MAPSKPKKRSVKSKGKPKAKVVVKHKLKARPKAKVVVKHKLKARPKAKVVVKRKLKARPKAKTLVKRKPKPVAKAKSKAIVKPKPKAQGKAKAGGRVLPPAHQALETAIRGIQKSYKNPIPEARFAAHIQRVAGMVAQSLTAAVQLMVACQIPSIELVSRMIIMDKDLKAGRSGTNKEVIQVLQRLGSTPLGKEALYRVVHAVSSSVVQKLLPISSSIPLTEIQKAAFMFAAQPLLQELLQEEKFVG
jgi:hypothetical protein